MNMEQEKYVVFDVAGTSYGIPTGQVRHIEMLEHVSLVPNANPAIDGVVFSRGQVIPALNLRTRFGLPREPYTLRTRIVFIELGNRTVGLIVDSAREFLRIPGDKKRPIEQTLTGVSGNYLQGVANMNGRLILLLDLDAVLNLDEYEPADSPGAEKTEPAPALESPTA
jgi:purine-binding chemotaxis protein CheW